MSLVEPTRIPVIDGRQRLTVVSVPDDAPSVIRLGISQAGGIPWRFVADLSPEAAMRLAEALRDLVHEMRPR